MYPEGNRRGCFGEDLLHKGVSPAGASPISALSFVQKSFSTLKNLRLEQTEDVSYSTILV